GPADRAVESATIRPPGGRGAEQGPHEEQRQDQLHDEQGAHGREYRVAAATSASSRSSLRAARSHPHTASMSSASWASSLSPWSAVCPEFAVVLAAISVPSHSLVPRWNVDHDRRGR